MYMWLCENRLKWKTAHFRLPSASQKRACLSSLIGSLSTRAVFETRTATGSELFSLLTCLQTTTFTLLSIFSPLEIIRVQMWETPLSLQEKCPLPVAVCVSKTCVLKLPIIAKFPKSFFAIVQYTMTNMAAMTSVSSQGYQSFCI